MNALMKLNNVELENSLGIHVRNERMSLDHIYSHINEIYRRELHLDQQYGTMKTYLVKRWKYSERDAYRKIDGARLLKEVPGVAEEIRNGNLNADIIGELSRAVKEKERASGERLSASIKSDLVKLVSGKSVGESQQKLAAALDIQVKEFETKKVQKDNSVRLGLNASEELYARLKICQDHASHKIQQDNLPHNLESMLKIFTDLYIKVNKLDVLPAENNYKKVPSQNRARSPKVVVCREVESRQMIKTNEFENVSDENAETERINRTLTPKTRREVLNRDKCCQFVNKDTGEICGETAFVQVDHKTPIWAGGTHEMENLQVLCANHNRRKYRKESQLSWL